PTGLLLRPDEGLAVDVGRGRVPRPAARRERAVGVVVVVKRQADLLEVVLALGAGGGFADFLDGGQEQADEHGDDGYDHQQLDQRETAARGGVRARHATPHGQRTNEGNGGRAGGLGGGGGSVCTPGSRVDEKTVRSNVPRPAQDASFFSSFPGISR